MTTTHPKTKFAAIALALALVLCLLPVSAFAELSVPASTATLTFTNSGITASGSAEGYEIDGAALKITAAGVYTVTGSCAEGSITVKKGTEGVTLVLKNLSLSSSATAPLSCNKETETTLYIVGTVTLNDNEDAAAEDSSEDFEGAAIKVKSGASLTIRGTGVLNANGSAKNGIKGAALSTVTVESGTLNITAANHGLASDNAVVIKGGTLNITAENEGVKASPDDGDTESLGDISISGGSVTVNAGDDGIHAGRNLLISGGSVTVSAGDDGLKAEYDLTVSGGSVTVSKSNEGVEGAAVNLTGGSGSITAGDDGVNAANSDLGNYAFTLNISGGDWYIDAGGDGLDSNGTITISGGVTEVFAAANDGNGALDSERGITYTGGTVLAVGMSGMAETPSSGVYTAFGASGMMGGGMMGAFGGQQGGFGGQQGGFGGQQGGFGGQQSGFGGQQGAFGGQQGGFGGQQGGFGGQQGAFGGQQGGFGGQQGGFGGTAVSISACDTLVIKDSSGTTLYSAAAVRNANSVVFASDALRSGETYTLYVNGSEAASATAAEGAGQMGGMPGGSDSAAPQMPEGSGDGSEAASATATEGAGQMGGMPGGSDSAAPQMPEGSGDGSGNSAAARPESSGENAPLPMGGPRVTVNGADVRWTDAAPFIDGNNRTMVPLRAVGEALGLQVNWDAVNREAVFADGAKALFFPIGSSDARTGDGGTLRMDTQAIIVANRTYAPIRYLAEYFGCAVDWDGQTKTVMITK